MCISGSFCAQPSRRGCFGRLRIADVNAAAIRRTYDYVSRLAAGWSLTRAVLAVLIRSSLAPPPGSCSACGDLLVDDVTVAGSAFRWGFTNLGRFARDYQDLSGETPVDDPPPARAVALAGAAAGQLARGLATRGELRRRCYAGVPRRQL